MTRRRRRRAPSRAELGQELWHRHGRPLAIGNQLVDAQQRFFFVQIQLIEEEIVGMHHADVIWGARPRPGRADPWDRWSFL